MQNELKDPTQQSKDNPIELTTRGTGQNKGGKRRKERENNNKQADKEDENGKKRIHSGIIRQI